MKMLYLANLFVADAPMKKKNQKIQFYPLSEHFEKQVQKPPVLGRVNTGKQGIIVNSTPPARNKVSAIEFQPKFGRNGTIRNGKTRCVEFKFLWRMLCYAGNVIFDVVRLIAGIKDNQSIFILLILVGKSIVISMSLMISSTKMQMRWCIKSTLSLK